MQYLWDCVGKNSKKQKIGLKTLAIGTVADIPITF